MMTDARGDADVVILSLDRVDETIAAINSALAQTGVSRQVFVIDQGSRADNLARLRQAIEGRADVTLHLLGSNIGVAGGRNLGSALGHARVIVGLDNDAEFATPDTLARMVAAFDEARDLAAIGCRILRFADGEDDLSSWGYARRQLRRAGECFDTDTFVGAGHAIRRAAWDAAGGYDDVLFFCWEEYDFCCRARALGWRIRYRGDIEIRHKVSGEQRVAWSGQRWYYFMRNRLYIGRKYGAHWVGLLLRFGWYMVRAWRDGAARHALRGAIASAELERSAYLLPPARARSNKGSTAGLSMR